MCEDAFFSNLPSPSHGRPSSRRTDRQAHLPTPQYHCRPSSCSTPKLFKDLNAAQPRHRRCPRFLLCHRLPPWPSSPAKKLKKHPGPAAHGALPQHSSQQKHQAMEGPAEMAPFHHGQVMSTWRTWDMSQLQRMSVRLDTQELVTWPPCREGQGIAGGHPHSLGLAFRGKRAGKSTWEGSSSAHGLGRWDEGVPSWG